MGHWVARDEDDLVSIVTSLARDVSGRQKFRLAQRDQLASSELCDSKDLTRALQDAFASMFNQYLLSNGSPRNPTAAS